MIDIDLQDEWGGIDEKIKSSVLGLNLLGIETTGSCEGDCSPCPWIMIKSSEKSIRVQVENLVKEFYKSRIVNDATSVKIYPVGDRFYIYAGSTDRFQKWRNDANESAALIAQGKKTKKRSEEIAPLEYQDEIMQFGAFLLKKAQ